MCLSDGLRWLLKAAMVIGTAMPRLLASSGSLGLMAKGCSEEECILFTSRTAAEVSMAVTLVMGERRAGLLERYSIV